MTQKEAILLIAGCVKDITCMIPRGKDEMGEFLQLKLQAIYENMEIIEANLEDD